MIGTGVWVNEESANGRFTPEQFVTKALVAGYAWFTYQWNDHELGPRQQAAWPAWKTAADGKLWDTIWLTRPFTPESARAAAIESGANGIILEGEIPSEWVNPSTGQVEPKPDAVDWNDVIFHLADLEIPKAVVSNSAPFVHHDGKPWPEKAKPLIDAGWAYISECFISESPMATPQNTDFFARHALGWPRTQPMVEGWHLGDYDLDDFKNVSHWDAGNVLQ